jgi:4'-phosphopantetheinyl transferase EntD
VNPAYLSPELAGLFPSGVIAAEVTVSVDREVLTPSELQFIAHCADKRIRDFCRGRACAHRALGELGIFDFSLLAGERREPVWPVSVIGSITHTDGFAAAVVSQDPKLRSIGIDCEGIDAVNADLWSRICVPGELQRLQALPPQQRGPQAALIFAAKEAFYKCQFSLTREWVDFEDVLIEPLDSSVTAGAMRIVPQKTLPLDDASMSRLVARFQFRESFVVAGVTAVT